MHIINTNYAISALNKENPKTMKKVIFILACTALFSSCKKSSTSFTADCSGTAKSYKTDVAPIMSSKCNSCHSQFSTYSGVSGDKTSIRSNIVDGNMPKGGSLSTAEKNAIVCWIDNGASNN